MSKFGIVTTEKKNLIEYEMGNVTLSNGLSPILMVKPATDANKPYMSALLRQNSQSRRSQKVTIKSVETNRHNDIGVYADHVIKDWRNVVDENDVPISYSPAEGREFIEQLMENNQSWVFDDLRVFCSDMSNFVFELIGDEDALKN